MQADQETGSVLINCHITAVLDGKATLPEIGAIRWGAVVVRLGRATAPAEPTENAGTLSVRTTLDVPSELIDSGAAVVLREPSLFAATVDAALSCAGTGVGSELAVATIRALTQNDPFDEVATRSPWLEAARDVLHAQFDRQISMRNLARRLGVHPVHASRTFANRYRITMTGYLRDLRLMRASELILRTHDSLSRIALRTGFADHAHLTRVFRARTGRPPSALRGGQALRLAS